MPVHGNHACMDDGHEERGQSGVTRDREARALPFKFWESATINSTVCVYYSPRSPVTTSIKLPLPHACMISDFKQLNARSSLAAATTGHALSVPPPPSSFPLSASQAASLKNHLFENHLFERHLFERHLHLFKRHLHLFVKGGN